MTKEEFYAEVAGIMEVDKGEVHDGVELASFEDWNSLSIISFIAFVDERLSLVIKPKELASAKSTDDLVSLVRGKLDA